MQSPIKLIEDLNMKKKVLSLILCAVCYLGIHNGYLALFDSAVSGPLMVLPYHVQMYPQADQEALQNGIVYNSPQELSRLLEDFLS